MASRSQQGQTIEPVEESGAGPWTIASAASVVLALFTFFVQRDRELGIFVGLWAPTILAFASYLKQQRMYETMTRVMERGGVIERVEKMVQRK
jgi:hypothetical protein